MYNSSSICAVSSQARVICPQYASKELHRFIVGTCSLHDRNELSVLQYSEDSNYFDVSCVFTHPDQVWAIEASPKDTSLVITSRQSKECLKSLTLWRMPRQTMEDMMSDETEVIQSSQLSEYRTDDDVLELEELVTFNQNQGAHCVKDVKWHSAGHALLTIDNRLLSAWKIIEGKIVQDSVFELHGKGDYSSDHPGAFQQEGCVSWDPHSSMQCVIGVGRDLKLVDTREMEVMKMKLGAHDDLIRSVDFNPNKPCMLVSAGNDRKVKFWDTRELSRPVRVLAGHSHWVSSAKYNPYHDQLVVSGGSDNLVNLWRIASCSSAPWLGSDEGSSDQDPPDVKVRCIDQHEEAVYGVAWSPADAWIYCSLSFDGRAIINHVPSTEKYKILL